MGISRRSVIIGSATLGAAGGLGLWALLADARLVPGRSVIDTVLSRCDLEPISRPEAEPGKILKASFYSGHRKKTVQYRLIYPPNAAPGVQLPVALYLHGEGGDETEAESLNMHRNLAGHVGGGMPGCVIFTVDGGDAYWHPRASGDNPLRMLLDEVPVVLRQHNLPTDKLAVMGRSSGGYGSLLLGSEAPERFVAVTAVSPAVFKSFDESHELDPKAFDSADDWRQYGDLRPRTDAFKKFVVRVDSGQSDTYASNLQTLGELMPDETVFFSSGCHDLDYAQWAMSNSLYTVGNWLTRLPPPAS